MDPTQMRYLEEEDEAMMKTIKGAVTGFAAGTIYGTVVATWKDVPRVERNVALPGLIRTLKMMGSHGDVFIGVELLVQNFRAKRDFFNGAIGGFVAGASVLGYKARSIPTAISAGAALAVTSALIDSGGQTTRVDTGREYYPYTVEKKAEADS
ncbi:Outer envelope pore protein 16-3, chloroplastic/mitochondrial [Cardamine amara subsp. amara]|uniref:Outer envelope pore protein 16-3, chloroplastic/mitochondrial n=1 Tax=Cardamine amara subsp. amara TaxID=228776 RepID=A0ABD1B4U6_CARAN